MDSVRQPRHVLPVLATLALTPTLPACLAGVIARETKLTDILTVSEAAPQDRFGSSVAYNGDTLVIGAPGVDQPGGPDRGAALVFVRSGATWVRQAKLSANDVGQDDGFGAAVAVSGDTMVVGVMGDPTRTHPGSAYVFVRMGTDWALQQKLMASDAVAGDRFGEIAIEGDTIVVGAIGARRPSGTAHGAVYVFTRTGTIWTQAAKLIPNDVSGGRGLGTAVAISGNTLIAGSPDDANRGSAYVFVRDGASWSQQSKLVASDAIAYDSFGREVDINGDTIVVGLPYNSLSSHRDRGSAYVFVRTGTTWSQQARLAASDTTLDNEFGWALALEDNMLVVGAYCDDLPGKPEQGSAYVFGRSGANWSEQAKLVNPGVAVRGWFGMSVSLQGSLIVVGAPLDDGVAGDAQGSVSVFARHGSTWSIEGTVRLYDEGELTLGDTLGASVDIDGNTILVGAPNDSSAGGVESGSAYVFVCAGTAWSRKAKLTPGDPVSLAHFGTSAAVSQHTAVVGAPEAEATYVFVCRNTGWSQQAKLIPSDDDHRVGFGAAVAIEGDTVAVGQAGIPDTLGSVYVFTRTGESWTEQAKLTASDGQLKDYFGTPVVIRQGRIVVGASEDRDPITYQTTGSAYVFGHNGLAWTERDKLTQSDGEYGGFGSALGSAQNIVAVGSPWSDILGAADQGSVYVFTSQGASWHEQARLTASDGLAGDGFGTAVALRQTRMLVGAPGDDGVAGAEQGSVYLFDRVGTNWVQRRKLTASDAKPSAGFGSAVAIRGDMAAVVGAVPMWPTAPYQTGSAYAYEFLPDCNENGVPDAEESLPDEDADGVSDACDSCPSTRPGATVDPFGCPVPVRADFDWDGDVDQSDFGRLQACLSGADVAQTEPMCDQARLDGDPDVDADDLNIFMNCLGGAQVEPEPDCAD